MDIPDYTKIVFGKIQKFEPELVTKIIGYLLLKEFGDHEMIRLAFGPDSAIHSLINEAKSAIPAINLSRNPATSVPIHLVHDLPQQLAPCSPTLSHCLTYRARHVPSRYWDPQFASGWQVKMSNMEFSPSQYSDPTEEDHQLLNQHSDSGNFVGDNLPSNYKEAYFGAYPTSGTSHSISNLTEFPLKVCHYYYRGYCKHGQNCRFFHGKHVVDSSAQLFLPNSELPTHEDYSSLPGSLGILELELTELLKSRGRKPISIAMLPSLYAERYGKLLVGDGYLTESQRHGKAGYSLSKLLARLSSSIQVVDRPHGQHSVVLAEDAHRYLEYPNERSDPGNVVVGSHQIYLTFPAESTFTEDDVSNYFKLYGPVQGVRIPDQQKRMFGFVSFLYPGTVKLILMKGNPHYICDSRILVKPYREKLRFLERQYNEKLQNLMNHPSHYLGDGSGLYSGSMTRNLVDEHGHIIALQRQLSSLPFGPRHIHRISNSCYFSEVMRHLEDRFRSQVNILNNISAGEEIIPSDNNNNKENSTTELSESSFASPSVGDDITTLK